MPSTARLTLVPPASASASPGHPLAAPGPGLRLTRRGRVVLLLAFLAVIVVLGVSFGSGTSAASGQAGEPRATRHLVVAPGQTLWGIALEVAPEEDPRATIERIRDLNALASTAIEAGQRIALP